MSWETPKIDWVADDFINVTDYNRIKNNLLYLYDVANTYYPPYNIEVPNLGDDMTVYDYPYKSHWNNIENALEALGEYTQALDVGDTKTFTDNGVYLDYTELNRIEKAELLFYDLFNRSKTDNRISFRAGIRTFYNV